MNMFTNNELIEISNALLNSIYNLGKAKELAIDVPKAIEAIEQKQKELQTLNSKVCNLMTDK